MKRIKKGCKFHYQGEYTAKKALDTDSFAEDILASFKRCGLVTEIQGDIIVTETSVGMFDRNYLVEFDSIVNVDMEASQIIDIISNQIMLSSRYLVGRNSGQINPIKK